MSKQIKLFHKQNVLSYGFLRISYSTEEILWDHTIKTKLWTSFFRYQEILSCGHPDTPRDARVSVSGYTAEYTCAPGHTHLGTRVSQCTEHGWSGDHVPTCRPVTCSAPPATSNGYIHITPYTGHYIIGTVALYKCKQGMFEHAILFHD